MIFLAAAVFIFFFILILFPIRLSGKTKNSDMEDEAQMKFISERITAIKHFPNKNERENERD